MTTRTRFIALALLVFVSGCAPLLQTQPSGGVFDVAVLEAEQGIASTLTMTGRLEIKHFQAQAGGTCATVESRRLAQALYHETQRAKVQLDAILTAFAQPLSGPCQIVQVAKYENLIVTAGKGFLVDAWQNSVELENMKYHGVGTGTTAAVVGNTALETESTTILNPDSTRATGSLTESAATIFRTVGTVTFDGAGAITEWGLLSQAATGGGVLWSRVVFAAINVANGDSLQLTYDLTVS